VPSTIGISSRSEAPKQKPFEPDLCSTAGEREVKTHCSSVSIVLKVAQALEVRVPMFNRGEHTYQAEGTDVDTMVTVDTMVIAEVVVDSCTTGGSVCTTTLVLIDVEVAVIVLDVCQKLDSSCLCSFLREWVPIDPYRLACCRESRTQLCSES
jgi:hypothetical protein